MYVILVYDVNVSRVNRVRKFLLPYLNWVQNSVFEGEITRANLERVINGVREIINPDEDSIILYVFRERVYFMREILGREKGATENII